MKRARALLVFLGVLCAVASGHPGYGLGAPKMAFEFGYSAFTDMSPVRRGLLSSDDVASGRLSKRQCGTGDLYCPATNFCCYPGYSCCSSTFCCATGYACPASGPCYAACVVTATYTSTDVITSSTVSTVYSTSTSWVTLTSTGYTTVTTQEQSGVSTSTAWATVTITQVMKRGAPVAPTPAMTEKHDVQAVAPKPSMEPSLVEGQTPIADLLRRALGNVVGLVEKCVAITSYQTIVYTSIYYSYSYYTIPNVVTSTSNTAVQSTVTSTIIVGASTTTTVTSTVTTTVTSSSSSVIATTPTPTPTPRPSPVPLSSGSSSPVSSVLVTSSSPTIFGTDNGLSQGAKIGIGVSVSLAAVFVFAAMFIFGLWWRRRSTAGGGASNRDTIINQPEFLAGAGAAGAAAGIGGEKVPVSPMSSMAATAVPSPPPTHQAYWAHQQAYELPQQTYPSPQQTYELSQG